MTTLDKEFAEKWWPVVDALNKNIFEPNKDLADFTVRKSDLVRMSISRKLRFTQIAMCCVILKKPFLEVMAEQGLKHHDIFPKKRKGH